MRLWIPGLLVEKVSQKIAGPPSCMPQFTVTGVGVGVGVGVVTVALDFEPDPILKNGAGGSAAALGAAGTIVTVATEIALASRTQCRLAIIRCFLETRKGRSP